MGNSNLDALADILDELRGSVEEQIDEATSILSDAEADAERTVRHATLVKRINDLLNDTRALRESIATNRDELNSLRARMRALLPPRQ